MKGTSQRVMLPQSDLLPKEGTRGAEVGYKEYAPREYLSREERTDGQ